MILDKEDIWNYVRVVNVRGEAEYQPTKDEKVVVIHRDNPILGNKHPKKVQTMRERQRVIGEFQKDLDADLAVQGPMWKALQAIARDIVQNNQKIALSCWCLPCDCHGLRMVPVIVQMAQAIWEHTYQANPLKVKI